jgi:hypothetical protein
MEQLRGANRTLVAGLGSIGFAGSMLIVIWECCQLIYQPIWWTPYDQTWLLVYGVACLAIASLAWIRQGRLLIVLTSGCITLFILANLIYAGTGLAFLMLIWFCLVSAGIGDRLVSFVTPTLPISPLERLIISISFGQGLLALGMLGLGFAQLFYPLVIYGLLAILTLFTIPTILRALRFVRTVSIPQGRVQWYSTDLRFSSIILASGALCLLGGLVWAVAPSVHFDALVYHLGVPTIYLREHGLVEITEEFRSYWAHNAEMLYTFSLLTAGQPLPTLLHLLSGILVTSWLFTLGKHIAGTTVGLVSALAFYSLPLVTFESGSAYIDLIVTLYVFGALAAAAHWWLDQNGAWLIISGISAGFALGSKLYALIVLVPLGGLILVGLVLRYGSSKSMLLGLARFVVPTTLLSLPWFVRDWSWTGNPIFPFYNQLFVSPKWMNENTQFNFIIFGLGKGVLDFLQLPWSLTARGEAFLENGWGNIGGLGLLALPWAYLSQPNNRRGFVVIILVLSLSVTALWFSLAQYTRYLLPFLPVFAYLTALNLDTLLGCFPSKRVRTFFIAAMLTIGMGYLFATRWFLTASSFHLPERYPYRVALGWQKPHVYLSSSIFVYDAFQFLNQKEARRVLSLGNDYRLYTDATIVPLGAPIEKWAQIPSNLAPAEIFNRLTNAKVTHILINDNIPTNSQWYKTHTLASAAFLDKYARLDFRVKNVRVYSIRSMPLETFLESSQNLLLNESFEVMAPQQVPENWYRYGNPLISHSSAQAHTGLVSVLATHTDGVYQRLGIVADNQYVLSHWTRAEIPNQFARLQINWLDDALKIVDVSLMVIPTGTEWTRHEMPVISPQGATWAQVYASVHGNSQVWFDDFEFVRMVR